jgi:prepilin-type N-terminal cleavage/methylation domain-containing protein
VKPLPIRITRAFSLIEVLVSVVVLALGLLGLAAVFPAVIRQQKEVMIARTSDSARDSVREAFARTSKKPGDSRFIDWDYLTNDALISASNVPNSCPIVINYTGEWETDWAWPGLPADVSDNYTRTGDVAVGGGLYFECVETRNGDATVVANEVSDLLLRDPTMLRSYSRLFPAPFSGLEPEYVWDFVPRKTAGGALQVAVFVRRIDSGIAVARGTSLSKILFGTIQGSDPETARDIMPVAETDDGVPTGNGRGRYSRIRRTIITIDAADPTIVRVPINGGTGLDADIAVARKGQKLIDEFDSPTVQTVIDRERDGTDFVLTLSPGYGEAQRGEQVSVIFTPQVAVDAFVETVR